MRTILKRQVVKTVQKWALLICLIAMGSQAWAADAAVAAHRDATLKPDLGLGALAGMKPSPVLSGLAPAEPWRLGAASARPGQGSFLDSLITPEQMEGIYLDAHEQAKAVVTRMLINLTVRLLD